MQSAKISPGNMKIHCPNISLPPVIACGPGVPCARRCYAMKAWRQYPSARAAWQHNLDLYQADPGRYFGSVADFLIKKRPAFFRWHVAGDVQDLDYFKGMLSVARYTLPTMHLCFTKRYDIVNSYQFPLPQNFRLMLSAWPGLELDNPHGFPVAWLSTDDRRPRGVFECPGDCKDCRHCWIDKRGVAFHPH